MPLVSLEDVKKAKHAKCSMSDKDIEESWKARGGAGPVELHELIDAWLALDLPRLELSERLYIATQLSGLPPKHPARTMFGDPRKNLERLRDLLREQAA